MDKEILNVSVEAGKLVAKESYEDAIQPTAKAFGQLVSLPIRAINAALEPCYRYVIESEQRLKNIQNEIQEKLKDVPVEKIVVPEKYIAIPALQKYCYSCDNEELKNMYTNLLAASMNIDTKSKVMPSYIDVISQLTPDEALLLKYIVEQDAIIAIEVKYITDKKDNGFNLFEDHYFEFPDNLLFVPMNVKVYIDNLIRLQLINCPKDRYRMNYSKYEELKDSYKTAVGQQIDVSKLEFTNRTIYLTEFGRSFINICLK